MTNTETKSYKRLLDAAVDAADRLQRASLKLDREAGNRLLKALVDVDIERRQEGGSTVMSNPSASAVKSPAETAAGLVSGKGNFPRPVGLLASATLQNSPLPSSRPAPVAGQI